MVVVVDTVIERCVGVMNDWCSLSVSDDGNVCIVVVDMMVMLITMWVYVATMAYLLYNAATISSTCWSHHHVALGRD